MFMEHRDLFRFFTRLALLFREEFCNGRRAMKHYHRVLTIAGSDSGGGAGIQADIKTMHSLGCYGMSAITAVTVQNTLGVKAVHGVPTDIVRGQIEAVLEDIGADAVKIGMLQSAEIVECVAEMLRAYNINNVVLDPVMVSTSGKRLLAEDGIEVLIERLIPLTRVITPNIPEAELLLGISIESNKESMSSAARELARRFDTSVLLKAGHMVGDDLIDFFYDNEENTLIELPSKRVDSRNTHGTGCTMSSAFASYLAKGWSLQDAARGAKEYINNAIIRGADYEIGKGHGPTFLFPFAETKNK